MTQIKAPETSTPIDLYNLSKCQIKNEKGETIEAGSLWKGSKAVIIFLRHFACIACRAHAQQVWQHREIYEKNNTKLFFIGNGDPQFIKGFKEDLGLEGAQIYTNPSLTTFRFAGFKRGFLRVVNLSSARNVGKLLSQGHRQTQLQAEGDHWQLGGVIAISADNNVLFHFISESLGDFPPEKDTIQASSK